MRRAFCKLLVTRMCSVTIITQASCLLYGGKLEWQKDIYVSGQIKDETGASINGVTCKLTWFKPTGITGQFSEETRNFDSHYEVFRPKSKKLGLRFLKEGYYGASVNPAPDDADTT